jgi:hypothetical protein
MGGEAPAPRRLRRLRRRKALDPGEGAISIVQRKVLEPSDFDDVAEVARTLNVFERRWNEIAEPFEWDFTHADLAALIERLTADEPQLQLAA